MTKDFKGKVEVDIRDSVPDWEPFLQPHRRRSYTVAAGVELESTAAEGVLFAQGGVAGGHSLFLLLAGRQAARREQLAR